ncbi:MAG: GNAT family N-acetyltransferase, partial [Candidatus Omnitrophica bacterium]|nr:GNAT family N-acetyltransferase [Candidatus Omnitrophota bacterium]
MRLKLPTQEPGLFFDGDMEGSWVMSELLGEDTEIVCPSVDRLVVKGSLVTSELLGEDKEKLIFYLREFVSGKYKIDPEELEPEKAKELARLFGRAAAIKQILGMNEIGRGDEVFNLALGKLFLTHQTKTFEFAKCGRIKVFSEFIVEFLDMLIEEGIYLSEEEREEIINIYLKAFSQEYTRIKNLYKEKKKEFDKLLKDYCQNSVNEVNDDRAEYLVRRWGYVLKRLARTNPDKFSRKMGERIIKLAKKKKLLLEEPFSLDRVEMVEMNEKFLEDKKRRRELSLAEGIFRKRGVGWPPGRFRKELNKYSIRIAACLNGKLLGYILGKAEGDTVTCARFSVLPHLNGRGIGIKLWQEFVKQADNKGYRKIVFESLSGEDRRAKRFSNRLGLKPMGVDYQKDKDILFILYGGLISFGHLAPKNEGITILNASSSSIRSDKTESRWVIYERFKSSLQEILLHVSLRELTAVLEIEDIGRLRKILSQLGISDVYDVKGKFLLSAVKPFIELIADAKEEKASSQKETELSYGGSGKHLYCLREAGGYILKYPHAHTFKYIDLYWISKLKDIAMKKLGGLAVPTILFDSRESEEDLFFFRAKGRGFCEEEVVIVQKDVIIWVEYLKRLSRNDRIGACCNAIDRYRRIVIKEYNRGVVDADRYGTLENYGVEKGGLKLFLFDFGELSDSSYEAAKFIKEIDVINEMLFEQLGAINKVLPEYIKEEYGQKGLFAQEDFCNEKDEDNFGRDLKVADNLEKFQLKFSLSKEKIRDLFAGQPAASPVGRRESTIHERQFT